MCGGGQQQQRELPYRQRSGGVSVCAGEKTRDVYGAREERTKEKLSVLASLVLLAASYE